MKQVIVVNRSLALPKGKLASAIPRVEAAAATIVADMSSLLQDVQAQTLIHADIHPSNVLVQQGTPYFIDWQTARWGPLYLDLPHHHCTLAQAELYRRALAARGYTIPQDTFAARYRVAARYIGLRYMMKMCRDYPSASKYRALSVKFVNWKVSIYIISMSKKIDHGLG